MYFAGSKGELWHFDGASWSPIDSAPSQSLYAICVATPDRVYAGGQDGVLLWGNRSGFTQIAKANATLRSLAFFNGRLHAATEKELFVLRDDQTLERIDLPLLPYSSSGNGRHRLHVAGGLLWSCSQLVIRVSEDGRAWDTLAQLPGEPPDEENEDDDEQPRPATAADLKGLSAGARPFFLAAGYVKEEARVTAAAIKAALKQHGFPAHAAALAFDQSYAGLMTKTSEEDDTLQADQSVMLGIHACLEGHLAWGFGPWQPHLHEEIAGSRRTWRWPRRARRSGF